MEAHTMDGCRSVHDRRVDQDIKDKENEETQSVTKLQPDLV